jgi:monoamine oxidase
LESVLSRLGKTGPRDTTFDGFAARCCKSARLRRNLSLTRAYVEGFNAADAKRISAKSLVESQEASEKIQGTRLFRLLNGYDSLVEALHAGLDSRLIRVSLNRTVKVLRWRRDDSAAVSAGRSDANDAKIKVTAVDPSGHSQAFTSDRAIVTLPLGILQARPGDTAAVDFQPTLSPRKTSAIARLAMGTVVKVILRFREAFWETMPLPALDPPAPLFDLSFLHGTDLSFSTWWTLRPLHTPMLIGWAGGPIAVELSRLSQEEILIEAINSLNALLGLPTETLRRQLSAHYIADWLSDPFSRGAYTYIPRGATDAVESLAAPEGGTLFFAGEATHHEGLSGTVAGAIGSGQRAAREVIAES